MYKAAVVCLILLFSLFTQSYGDDGTYVEKTEAELYDEAVELFDQKKYKQAIRAFQAIEDLYPLSYWAMKAKLLSGASSYNLGDYGSAASSIDDYIYIYSNGEDLPYAHYLRVLSYYMQINKVQLGQQTAYKALELATEYINLFPDSEYIDEIKEKGKLITEHISEKEYAIGKFYLKRGEYLAAIKRFQNIVSYENSSCSPKSINYLVKAYLALGLDLEAKQYESILSEDPKPTA